VSLTIASVGRTIHENYIARGVSALDLLSKNHNVSGSNYITCIDNVCGGNDYSWYFYVNGKLSPVSAKSYTIVGNEKIEFRLEKI